MSSNGILAGKFWRMAHCFRLADIFLDKLCSLGEGMPLSATHVIKHDNMIARLYERLNEMSPDKTSSARYQNTHAFPLES